MIPAFGLPGWLGFAQALAEAEGGDASAFSSSLATDPRESFGGLAVYCVDFPRIAGYGDLVAKMRLGRGCMRWPVPIANPPHRARIRGAPPILLANATHDPSTPYVWAHGLLDQIPSAILVTREGDGHTASWLQGRSRTCDAIVRYLITGSTPPPNTVYPD